MKRFRNHLIGVEQGDFVLFSDFETDGAMWTGEGERRMRARIDFSESYRRPPAVQLAPSMWDISNTVFVNVVAAWFRFMLCRFPGRPWGRRRQLLWRARRRPHGLRAGFLTALD